MKVGVFAPWGIGDVCNSTSVLRYKNSLWPESKIVWFVSKENRDLLKFSPEVDEIRDWPFPWAQTNTNWQGFRTEQHGVMNPLYKTVPALHDLDKGYFSVPWSNRTMLSCYHLAIIPKVVFGVEDSCPWHPMVNFSPEEDEAAKKFLEAMPYKKTVMIEVLSRSGQSNWPLELSQKVMEACEKKLGKANFVFASPKSAPDSRDNIKECGAFTVRQCIPIYNRTELFIGVSSGISCATSSWFANAGVPRIEMCGAINVSTIPIARGKAWLTNNPKELVDNILCGEWMRA